MGKMFISGLISGCQGLQWNVWKIPANLHCSLNMKAADYILDGKWNIPDYFMQKNAILVQQIVSTILPMVLVSDKLHWTSLMDGNLTNKLSYAQLRGLGQIFLGAISFGISMYPYLDLSFSGDQLLTNCLPMKT